MFIYCFSKEMKEELVANGFVLLKDDKNKSVFVFDKTLKFNFEGVDKTKYIITNKLTI